MSCSGSRPALLAALGAVFVAGLTSSAAPASAQFFNFFDPPPRAKASPAWARNKPERAPRRVARSVREDEERVEKKAAAKDAKAPAPEVALPAAPAQMVYAVVSLADQRISVYGGDGLLARSRISSGQEGFRTPTGIYGILEKNREHESNIYDGAPMPFMQRLTWSGIALHQGVVPRYPASHGCIRLPAAFAAKLWDMTRIGARVMVSSVDVEPAAIEHARLPVARMVAPESLGLPQRSADAAAAAPVVRLAANDEAAGLDQGLAAEPRRLNPIETAAALKARANRDAVAARKAADAGIGAARAAATEANDTASDLRDARSDLEDARKAGPAERAEYLERRVAELTALEASRSQRALDLAVAVREAERTVEAAREAASNANRRAAPLSVLISRKEGLVMIKQGMKPVFEAPFALRDPKMPLGTHMFVATAPADDSGRLRWSALTVPGDGAAGADEGNGGKPKRGALETEPGARPSTAAEALDRIELTPETEQKLAELIWVGGSIIVSDRSLGPEYGDLTDLVVAIP